MGEKLPAGTPRAKAESHGAKTAPPAEARGDHSWVIDAIFHARSRDLKTWEVYAKDGRWDTTMNPKCWAAVLAASPRWYDAWHNGDPSFVFKGGKFFMVYIDNCISNCSIRVRELGEFQVFKCNHFCNAL